MVLEFCDLKKAKTETPNINNEKMIAPTSFPFVSNMKVALLMQDENICIFASWGIDDVVGVLLLSSSKPKQQKVFFSGIWVIDKRK